MQFLVTEAECLAQRALSSPATNAEFSFIIVSLKTLIGKYNAVNFIPQGLETQQKNN